MGSESRLVSEKLPQPVLKAVEKAIDTISPYLSTHQEAYQLGVLLSEVAFAAFEAGRSTQSETETVAIPRTMLMKEALDGAAPSSRAALVHEHDCPKVWEFFKKHALGSLACPSCLLCGQQKDRDEWKVRHAELPDIYICATCVDGARSPEREPDGYAVLLDDPKGDTPGQCGYWYVGAYRTEAVAKNVAERGKQGARVVPMYFAAPANVAPRACPSCGKTADPYCDLPECGLAGTMPSSTANVAPINAAPQSEGVGPTAQPYPSDAVDRPAGAAPSSTAASNDEDMLRRALQHCREYAANENIDRRYLGDLIEQVTSAALFVAPSATGERNAG